jgi:hypothetical protein
MALPALGESNIQFCEAWKLYARASPAGEVIEIPGLTITDANLSWVFVNVAFLTEPGDHDLERHAQEAIAHFASDGRPYALADQAGRVPQHSPGPPHRRDQSERRRASRTPSTNLRSTSRIVASLVGPRAIGSSLTITARTAPSV